MKYMAGGVLGNGEYSKDILIYVADEDKWTKTGDLCRGRAFHAMSLVHAVVDEECILDIDCWLTNVQNKQKLKSLTWYLKAYILWSSGKGQARIGKDRQGMVEGERPKSLELRALPRAYIKVTHSK